MEIVLRLADVFRENLPMRKTREKILREVITQFIKTRRPFVVSTKIGRAHV